MRRAVRAVLLDPEGRALLTHFEFPDYSLWATPGGGIDEGEPDGQALRRELAEELGLEDFDIGPLVWRREHVFEQAYFDFDGQSERFYLVRTEAFEPRPRLSAAQLRKEFVTGVRWWTLHEIEKSSEVFAPRNLAALISDLIAHGAPDQPLDVCV